MTGKCGNCGTDLKYQARFCGRCGTRVELAEVPPRAKPSQKPENDRPGSSNVPPPSNAKRRRQTVAIPLEQLSGQSGSPTDRTPPKQPERASESNIASKPTETPAEPIGLTEPLFPELMTGRPETEEVPIVKSEFPILPPNSQNAQEQRQVKPQVKVRGSGQWTVPDITQAAALSVASSSNRKWIALAVPVVLLFVACGLFFVFNSRRSAAEPNDANQLQVISSPTPALQSQPVSSPAAVTETAIRPSLTGRRVTPSPTLIVAAAKPTPGPKEPVPVTKPAELPAPIERKEPQSAPTPASVQPVARSTAQDYLNQGVANLNAGRFQEAIAEFEKARRLAPGNVDVYYLIGQAYHKLGRLDQALAAYRQCTSGVYASVAKNNVRMLELKMSTGK